MEKPILSRADFQLDSGRRLRLLIEKLDITQVEAARLMGVSKHVLRNWLAGEHPIGTYALYRLTQAKNLDFNYVFLGDWGRLPYDLAKQFEAETIARLGAQSEQGHQAHESSEA